MNLIIRKRDVYISIGAILAFSAFVGYSLYDNSVMHAELKDIAEQEIDSWFAKSEPPADRNKFDYLAIVDSKKAFRLFGRGWGVIHCYYREKGDQDFKTFKGIEYFYKREGGKWVLKDSAGCGAFEHHLRAFNELMKTGVDVPNRVFDRALGIDFAYGADHEHEGADGHKHDDAHEHTHDLPTANKAEVSS